MAIWRTSSGPCRFETPHNMNSSSMRRFEISGGVSIKEIVTPHLKIEVSNLHRHVEQYGTRTFIIKWLVERCLASLVNWTSFSMEELLTHREIGLIVAMSSSFVYNYPTKSTLTSSNFGCKALPQLVTEFLDFLYTLHIGNIRRCALPICAMGESAMANQYQVLEELGSQ